MHPADHQIDHQVVPQGPIGAMNQQRRARLLLPPTVSNEAFRLHPRAIHVQRASRRPAEGDFPSSGFLYPVALVLGSIGKCFASFLPGGVEQARQLLVRVVESVLPAHVIKYHPAKQWMQADLSVTC